MCWAHTVRLQVRFDLVKSQGVVMMAGATSAHPPPAERNMPDEENYTVIPRGNNIRHALG